MSPTRLSVLALALLAAASLAPATLGAPLVPDAINGAGTASTFQVFAEGLAIEGGAHDWNEVCGPCDIRITTGAGSYLLLEADGNGGVQPLPPGRYELRDFRGLFAFTVEGRHSFTVQLHGLTKLERLE